MSAALDITFGQPVLLLEVGEKVQAHPGYIQSEDNKSKGVIKIVGGDERQIQLSDPRVLTLDEAQKLRDIQEAQQWFMPHFTPKTVDRIHNTLRRTNLSP